MQVHPNCSSSSQPSKLTHRPQMFRMSDFSPCFLSSTHCEGPLPQKNPFSRRCSRMVVSSSCSSFQPIWQLSPPLCCLVCLPCDWDSKVSLCEESAMHPACRCRPGRCLNIVSVGSLTRPRLLRDSEGRVHKSSGAAVGPVGMQWSSFPGSPAAYRKIRIEKAAEERFAASFCVALEPLIALVRRFAGPSLTHRGGGALLPLHRPVMQHGEANDRPGGHGHKRAESGERALSPCNIYPHRLLAGRTVWDKPFTRCRQGNAGCGLKSRSGSSMEKSKRDRNPASTVRLIGLRSSCQSAGVETRGEGMGILIRAVCGVNRRTAQGTRSGHGSPMQTAADGGRKRKVVIVPAGCSLSRCHHSRGVWRVWGGGEVCRCK
jgi:hypothetical protein